MKLAEALAERSDCQVRLEELKKRILRSARVQEGEQPAEDVSELLSEIDKVHDRLLELICAINRTNAQTRFDESRMISDAIVTRELLGKKRDMLAAMTDAASTRQDRYSKSEVKFVATVSVSQLQKQIDALSKQYREVDTRLQELNWKTDLN
jgi:uncharacterized coiled-coil DUF342 family protein